MEVAENIKAYCEKNNITPTAFEKKCDLYDNAVVRWSNGTQSPTMKTMMKIVNATGIPLDRWMKKGGV